MLLFDVCYCAGICLHTDSSAVMLAACDLQRDLRRLSGQRDGFAFTPDGNIEIRIIPGVPESYTVEVDSRVVITGGDELGAIYGIYAFEDRCLDILPIHRVADVFPDPRQKLTISSCSFASGQRPVRWRGWFLNDEDLLTELVYSGGKRHIDYPFYGDVMDTAVLDRILETALRLEINLVIPGSFVDILNPDERKLVSAVCRRGLYISQHHVEPVGVSYFAADAYMQKHGDPGEAVSFVTNRSRMEEIWQTYVTAWAQFGRHVVWQLGLRGKGDQAVWMADPNAPMTDEARGQLITDAIFTQHAMIQKILGTEFASTATLWNEGSMLYGKGYLQLPENTVAVFADLGISQMFGEDFYTMPRKPDAHYGVYYHSAFWTCGPHLAEGCRPKKMVFCLRDAWKQKSLHYAILNVSNVRPVHYGAAVFSKILQDPQNADAHAITMALDRRLFGPAGEQVNALRTQYYDAFADFGREALRTTAERWQFYYRSHEAAPFTENALTDGYMAFYGKALLQGTKATQYPAPSQVRPELEASERKFSAVWQELAAIQPAGGQYLDQFLKYQTVHMWLLTRWCLRIMDMLDGKPDAKRQASACLEQLLEERKILEEGPWKHWHRGDKKINIPLLLQMTKGWK